jgi:hypothetical protein
MPTDAERAMELAEWHANRADTLETDLFLGLDPEEVEHKAGLSMGNHRDTARLLREYAGMAERVGKLEEALREIDALEKVRSYEGCLDCDRLPSCSRQTGCPSIELRGGMPTQAIARAALAPPAQEPPHA